MMPSTSYVHLTYLWSAAPAEIVTMQRPPSDIRYYFKAETPFGICEIMLSKDAEDGHFYDFANIGCMRAENFKFRFMDDFFAKVVF